MIRFFHTADVHFGVENYGKIDQKTGLNSRFLDFVKSFETLVDQAIEEDIDFFLFCGDAYKTAYPTPTQQKQLLRLLFKLQQAKIPVAIIVGNHDHPLSFGKSHALDVFSTVPLGGMHVFSKPELLKLQTKSGAVQIVGIPWPLRQNVIAKQEHRHKDPTKIAEYISQTVGAIISDFAQKLDKDIPAVLAGHLTVSNGIFSGSEKCAVIGTDPLFLPSQLALPPFDYVALGHLHRHQNLNKGGYPAVVYSGSIERIDFGERKEPKGFCSVSIDKSKQGNERCSFKFIELPSRPMIQIELELVEGKNQTKQIVEKIEKYDLSGAIVKIVYHIGGDSSDNVDLLAIQRACSDATFLASITPVRKSEKRKQRADLNVSMSFEAIVEKYLEYKGHYADLNIDSKRLKEKALQMYAQVLQERPEEETGATGDFIIPELVNHGKESTK